MFTLLTELENSYPKITFRRPRLVSNRWKHRFSSWIDSFISLTWKFTIKLLTANSQARRRKQSKKITTKNISAQKRQWQLIRHTAREVASLLSDSLVFRPLWHFHLHTPIDKIKYPFGSHPSAPHQVITPPLHHTLSPLYSSIPPSLRVQPHHDWGWNINRTYAFCRGVARVHTPLSIPSIWGHLYKSPQGRAHFNFSFSSYHHLSCLFVSVSRSPCIPKQLHRSAAIS